MTRHRPYWATLMFVGIAACSAPADPRDGRVPNSRQMFSADDQAAAKALSITASVGDVGVAPPDRPLLCAAVLPSLSRTLKGAGALDEAKEQALVQVQRFYENKARASRSDRDLRLAEARMSQRFPSSVQRTQIAVGCLQDLVAQSASGA